MATLGSVLHPPAETPMMWLQMTGIYHPVSLLFAAPDMIVNTGYNHTTPLTYPLRQFPRSVLLQMKVRP